MPHFSVSWDHAVIRLCPEWLEKQVNEDGKKNPGLDVEMSLRLVEKLPLPPLSPELASIGDQGIQELTTRDISVIEAMFDVPNAPAASG